MKQILLGWFLIHSVECHACRVEIKNQIAQGDVSRFTISVQHAAFRAVDHTEGWVLTIYNDPSWRTYVTGYAYVGAADRSTTQFSEMIALVLELGYTCHTITNLSIKITVSSLAANGLVKDRRLVLKGGSVSVVP